MEIVKDILYILVTVAVPALTTSLCKFLYTKWTEGKVRIKNEKISNTLDNVVNMVLDAVEATNQVFVDELKKNGEFTETSALEAFNITKEKVLDMLSDDAAAIIVQVYGDLDIYIDTLIEATVRQLKK